MEEFQIERLVERCETFLRKAGYRESLISRYHYVWQVGIQSYMQERNLAFYNADIGNEYSKTCCDSDGHVRSFDRVLLRSIQMLDDMLATGCIRKTNRTATVREFCGEIGNHMQDFLQYLAGIRRSKGTIEIYERCLHDFLQYLTDHSVLHLLDISEQCVVGFLQPYTNKQGGFKSLRGWFSYMEEEGVMPNTFMELFDSFPKLRRHQEVPSFYSVEEIKKIESSIKRSSAVGKRNYAMFLLASRLGLRASDIAHLKFNDIDWEKIHRNPERIKLNTRVWELVVEDDDPMDEREEDLKEKMIERIAYFTNNFNTKEEYINHSSSLWYWGVATEKKYEEVNYKISDMDWCVNFFDTYLKGLEKTNPLITIYETHCLD